MPSVRQPEQWDTPPTKDQAADAVEAVVTATGADMTSEQQAVVISMVHRRGYSEAELAYAMEQLIYDPEVEKKLRFEGGRITPADFERVIMPHRRMRKKIRRKQGISTFELGKLLDEWPDVLDECDFGCLGYDNDGRRRWRFYEDAEDRRDPPEARPALPDTTPGANRERADGKHGGPIRLADAASEVLNHENGDASP